VLLLSTPVQQSLDNLKDDSHVTATNEMYFRKRGVGEMAVAHDHRSNHLGKWRGGRNYDTKVNNKWINFYRNRLARFYLRSFQSLGSPHEISVGGVTYVHYQIVMYFMYVHLHEFAFTVNVGLMGSLGFMSEGQVAEEMAMLTEMFEDKIRDLEERKKEVELVVQKQSKCMADMVLASAAQVVEERERALKLAIGLSNEAAAACEASASEAFKVTDTREGLIMFRPNSFRILHDIAYAVKELSKQQSEKYIADQIELIELEVAAETSASPEERMNERTNRTHMLFDGVDARRAWSVQEAISEVMVVDINCVENDFADKVFVNNHILMYTVLCRYAKHRIEGNAQFSTLMPIGHVVAYAENFNFYMRQHGYLGTSLDVDIRALKPNAEFAALEQITVPAPNSKRRR
jgi:hypothetical protein